MLVFSGNNVAQKSAWGNGTATAAGTPSKESGDGRSGSEPSPEDSGPGGDKLAGPGATQDDSLHLERRVGLFSGVALIVGTMIGSGIFVSPSGLLIRTGSVGMSFVIWISCGVLSLLVVILVINCYSVNLATGVQNVFTCAKLAAVAIVVCGGGYRIFQGNVDIYQLPIGVA
ncbi:hypothetical protein WDU94_009539 [Cyamophila willieti]